jgi:hypothetical protein
MGTSKTDKDSKAKAAVKSLKPKQDSKAAGKDATAVKGGRKVN